MCAASELRLHMQRIIGMLDVVENAELHETTSLVYLTRHLPLISARSSQPIRELTTAQAFCAIRHRKVKRQFFKLLILTKGADVKIF